MRSENPHCWPAFRVLIPDSYTTVIAVVAMALRAGQFLTAFCPDHNRTALSAFLLFSTRGTYAASFSSNWFFTVCRLMQPQPGQLNSSFCLCRKLKADVLERTSGEGASTSSLVSADYSLADDPSVLQVKDCREVSFGE